MRSRSVADVPPHLQTFLAFDFGLKRTGVASGNRLLRTRQPRGPPSRPRATPAGRRWPAHCRMAARCAGGGRALPPRWRQPRQHRARAAFARQLHGRFGLPVFEVDERYSTTEALAANARDADAAAACIILEQFLRSLAVSEHPDGQLDAEALYRELLRGVRSPARPGDAPGGHHLRRRLAGRAAAGRPGPGRPARRDFIGHAPRRLCPARPGGRRQQTAAALRRERRRHPAAGRRALHRPHHPRRAQRAVRLRPPGQRALAVLVDRGGRELPVQADFAAARVALPRAQSLALARDDDGHASASRWKAPDHAATNATPNSTSTAS
jgi:putative Holliday junction resolvase